MGFVLWLTVRLLTSLLVLPNAEDGTKDLEILVLRQQLGVLRRKSGRPKFAPGDRVLPAAASRVLPRQRWGSSFLVTPQTLLGRHRALVRRKWAYGKQRPPGRPPRQRACGSCGSIDWAGSFMSMPRSHGVGEFSAPTGPTVARHRWEVVTGC